MLSNFKENIKDIYYKSDQVLLKSLEFSVNENNYYIDFGIKNQAKEDYKIQSVIKAIDQDYNKELEEPHIDNPEIIQKVTDTIGTEYSKILKTF
ncbi:hypothetical protein F8M41_017593 [Gigaspora margarita]|uniref:Uncharacterized protein n=1 Tax=Gigaspora margarita TaxID=4874 RepID=A0A8H4AMW1_GIGMA|nr:hypothetical protein F8M41_017593 [Gigaspora margarita]